MAIQALSVREGVRKMTVILCHLFYADERTARMTG